MKKRYISWREFFEALKPFDKYGGVVYGVPKGGMIATSFMDRCRVTHSPDMADFILDDIVDSGYTKEYYNKRYPSLPFFSLFTKEDKSEWIVFPWEADHPMGEENIQQNIVRQLQYIGEDPEREGLRGTPDRIVKSWGELYSGYNEDPEKLIVTFGNEKYNQLVLLKDIELYSMCEHHMLPFMGKAHIAYIPGKGEDGRVLGISKLARLLDVYARRLQIQERLTEQVTEFLMNHANTLGAACIIEASHLCMRMRGCSKQNSVMVTSSMKGVFFDVESARMELLMLVK